MKDLEIVATTGKKGTPDYKEFPGKVGQYETLAEAVGGLTEAVCLEKVNYTLVVDAKNALRRGESVGKNALVNQMITGMNDDMLGKLYAMAKDQGNEALVGAIEGVAKIKGIALG